MAHSKVAAEVGIRNAIAVVSSALLPASVLGIEAASAMLLPNTLLLDLLCALLSGCALHLHMCGPRWLLLNLLRLSTLLGLGILRLRALLLLLLRVLLLLRLTTLLLCRCRLVLLLNLLLLSRGTLLLRLRLGVLLRLGPLLALLLGGLRLLFPLILRPAFVFVLCVAKSSGSEQHAQHHRCVSNLISFHLSYLYSNSAAVTRMRRIALNNNATC